MENKITTDNSLVEVPVLPLRDVVVYPYMVIPLFVGRERSINALEVATDETKQVLLVAQKDSSEDKPNVENLYETGTLANILQLLKLPDGTVKVLVEGGSRATLRDIDESCGFFTASADIIESEILEESLQKK